MTVCSALIQREAEAKAEFHKQKGQRIKGNDKQLWVLWISHLSGHKLFFFSPHNEVFTVREQHRKRTVPAPVDWRQFEHHITHRVTHWLPTNITQSQLKHVWLAAVASPVVSLWQVCFSPLGFRGSVQYVRLCGCVGGRATEWGFVLPLLSGCPKRRPHHPHLFLWCESSVGEDQDVGGLGYIHYLINQGDQLPDLIALLFDRLIDCHSWSGSPLWSIQSVIDYRLTV